MSDIACMDIGYIQVYQGSSRMVRVLEDMICKPISLILNHITLLTHGVIMSYVSYYHGVRAGISVHGKGHEEAARGLCPT